MPFIVAHRGFSGRYPEHTPEAFEAAFALPIHGVECDVRLSKNGELVVAHDPVKTSDGLMSLDELLDMFAAYPRHHLYIEIKHPSRFGPEVQEQTLRTLRHHRLHADLRIHIISFNRKAVRYFRARAPELETFQLMRPRDRCSPVPGGGIGPSISMLQNQPELLRRGGARTYTWTVNTPLKMQWCAEHGVDVFATDLPDLALETLGTISKHGTKETEKDQE